MSPVRRGGVTFSIIARDRSGSFGVGVASHWFNVGRFTAWVRFGAGAVATQALTDTAYGWKGLDLMGAGVPADVALRALLESDDDADRRQVGFIDAAGRVAVHTGVRCVEAAGHIVGEGWAVLGNLLVGREVLKSMAAAFVSSQGELGERLVETLDAGRRAGGDLRGEQSAAVRVVPPEEEVGEDAGVEVLVADHPNPIGELARLVEIDRAYRLLRRGQKALIAGDWESAATWFQSITTSDGLPELEFWRALGLWGAGQREEATRILKEVFSAAPEFVEVLARLSPVDEVAARVRTELGFCS
ncbi:MAG: hypothetical protein KatS3mg011_2098 [Acidimicrobiia bacterium]|nr:MAG: hypothetical protein KatS3mg011_2098 [Acidimicrobiia bacterium]